jgi:hypothetical protein
MTALQRPAQILQGPPLELFDRALRFAERRRDFERAAVLSEPQLHDSPLIVGQPIDELKEHGAALEVGVDVAGPLGIRRI